MKKLFIVANWKSNKKESEAREWLAGFMSYDLRFIDKEIIVCPPLTVLSILNSLTTNPPARLAAKRAGETGHKSNIKLGAQDISQFPEGAYTGAVNGKQIREFADYVIIGHSERRNNFGEDQKIINKKISLALKYNLIPILCVSDIKQIHDSRFNQSANGHNSNFIVAYEPTFAVGTGMPDTPENADKMCQEIKNILGEVPTLYGGSVNKDNIKSFTNMLNIDGALVGQASLDPLEFLGIVKNA